MAPEVMARAEPPRHRVGRSEHTHIGCLPDPFLRAYGLPHYLKFVQTPDLLIMLNEYNGVYRQIFTDGRPLPEAPNPSVGRLFDGHLVRRHAGDRHHRISR